MWYQQFWKRSLADVTNDTVKKKKNENKIKQKIG